MLASNPVSMVNQKRADLGIPNRINLNSSRFRGAGRRSDDPKSVQLELLLSTVTARRFCDQHEMSLQTATGRSLP